MKLRQILEQTGHVDDLQHYAQLIVRDCQPALSEVISLEDYGLFRGIVSRKEFVDQQIRSDRQPKDTSKLLHDLMNQWFEDNFGIAYRSSAIAATGDQAQAEEYGSTFMVFPKGQFSYLWSPSISDIGIHIPAKISQYMLRTMNVSINGASKEQFKHAADQILNSITFKTDDLEQAMKAGSEIMIHGDSYYGISVDVFSPRAIRQALRDAM